MKRFFIIGLAAVFVVALVSLLSLYIIIGIDVKSNIEIAQMRYGGNPEEALISYLEDDSNSCSDRTHLAVWTLGQIRSEKALSVLMSYYNDDPEGVTCFGKHDQWLCQYELHKAIEAIENRPLFSFASLKSQ